MEYNQAIQLFLELSKFDEMKKIAEILQMSDSEEKTKAAQDLKCSETLRQISWEQLWEAFERFFERMLDLFGPEQAFAALHQVNNKTFKIRDMILRIENEKIIERKIKLFPVKTEQ